MRSPLLFWIGVFFLTIIVNKEILLNKNKHKALTDYRVIITKKRAAGFPAALLVIGIFDLLIIFLALMPGHVH